MILADNETKVDLLNNEAIATTIIKPLHDRPDRPDRPVSTATGAPANRASWISVRPGAVYCGRRFDPLAADEVRKLPIRA